MITNDRLSRLPVKPASIEELKVIVSEIWLSYTVENIRNLYQSMPKRLQELHRVQGRNTKF